MSRRSCTLISFVVLVCLVLFSGFASAQQTLGGITGLVTDAQGSIVPGASAKLVGEQTGLVRTQVSGSNGYYDFPNLPIGTYTITVTHDGFQTEVFPSIAVQADRTATVNVTLSVGAVTQSVTVNAVPLMNAVDTTVGYVLEKEQIEAIPLPTGSFTGVAILSPGVNAEFSGGTGANSGLGNAPIWANGQRDTSNSFSLNGVDASNFFNGKSTSQVESSRIVNNTGQSNNAGGGVVPSSASIYLAIGNSIPTPAPETIEEIRVNSSMYDAQQGSTSGAHIDLSTKSGTNAIHGSTYFHRGTNALNAAPFFFKKDSNIPLNDKNPELHRYTVGGTLGGPIVKDKLFGFISYQHLHVSDQETGDELLVVPPSLSDTNRTPTGLAGIANNSWTWNQTNPYTGSGLSITPNNWTANPVGLALFQHASLPGEPGKWLIPNQTPGDSPNIFSPYNTFLPGTARFKSDQAIADLDWNASAKDVLSLKYYYQHDPSESPYAYSNVPGFTAHVDAGSQVFSINNAQTLRPTFNVTETFGFLREKAYSTNDQPFTPAQVGMSSAFGNYFSGITINDALGDQADSPSGPLYGLTANSLSIGPDAASQGANTGVFQNRLMPSANAIWTKGPHTVTFGSNYSYTQLNVRDRRTGTGTVATPDFNTFAENWVTPYSTQNFTATDFLQGNANRYYRANEVGAYVQDKFQVTPTLSLTAGVRYDWDGGLTEKNGDLFNFNPSLYQYNAGSDSFTAGHSGFEIAGVNGVSNTTLTGRQWGFGPRIGAAWQPEAFKSKLVVRAGTGIYYDRGELYTYLSPGYAAGEITGGPLGVNQTEPFVSAQQCPYSSSLSSASTSYLYQFYIPICGAYNGTSVDNSAYNLATPWGTVRSAAPNNPRATDVANYLPNAANIINGAAPFTLGVYNPANKLPYSINFTLNVQWQPRNDLMVELAYVGNLGRHQVVPVPFNQAQVATPASPVHGTSNVASQLYSYGYTVLDPNTFGPICVNLDATCKYGPMLNNYEGGNVDLRVPYLGYSSESESYTAAGISAYHAMQLHVIKRLTHGFQAGGSWTYSHTTDEQSGMGLFYNGSNPDTPPYLRSGYGSADFDRTHVINFTYSYTLPKFYGESTLAGRFADGWAIQGIATFQSGQPYSVIDYSGAVGSLYYSTFDGITNPVVPLAAGCTKKNAVTGQSGAFYNVNTGAGAALKATCFTIPLISPGTKGVPAGDYYETDFTNGQRNIFRQSFQRRADASLVKTTQISEKSTLRYTFDAFNLTNTTSLDIPVDNVSQNQGFNNEPFYVGSSAAALPTGCGTSAAAPGGLYNCPAGLGIAKHAIGSARQIQMSLGLTF
jgi:Carboxypeptidase regulatory-like domain